MRLLEHCDLHTRLLLHTLRTALPQRLPVTSSRCGPAAVHVGGTSRSDISTEDRDQGSYMNSPDLRMLAITLNLVQAPWEPHKPVCRPFLAQGPPGDNLRPHCPASLLAQTSFPPAFYPVPPAPPGGSRPFSLQPHLGPATALSPWQSFLFLPRVALKAAGEAGAWPILSTSELLV